MDRSQWYIGTPNGVVLCVDGIRGRQFSGRMYHAYSKEMTVVDGIGQLLFALEDFFESINFPHASTNERSFQEKIPVAGCDRKREKIMSDEELLKKHGDLGTFIIRVQQRQNSSWQGRITWMDKNETVYFRSVWEMIKLIASALNKTGGEKEEEEVSWRE